MRKIPSTMSTQHPDNASPAFWCKKSFINTTDEIEEAYGIFSNLGCDEYMWDWEGKFVDEAVIDKLFRRYSAYFKKHPLGKEKFLTYRIPNIWAEGGYRLARPFINIVTSADFARELGFYTPPVMEIILPMTRNAEQILKTKETFRRVAQLKCRIFEDKRGANRRGKRSKRGRCGAACAFSDISVIPLIESVKELENSGKLIEKYLQIHKKTYGRYPQYLRPFIARSDPALNSGIVPAVLASKVALSHFYNLEKKYGVRMFPIIGTGSLPFRGGVNPENIEEVIGDYNGIRTITIQSAFKYDYPQPLVRRALKYIDKTLPRLRPRMLSEKEIDEIKKVNKVFSQYYKNTVERLAPFVNKLAAFIPSRRERLLHIGLFGYSRGIGKVTLPRAIPFTGVFYSIGVPPEFIGTGRGLRWLQKNNLLPYVKSLYINLFRDLEHAGKYLNKDNLARLAKKMPVFKEIIEDIQEAENILGVEFGPFRDHHYLHKNLTSNIYFKIKMKSDPANDIIEAAVIRKSLG